MQNYLRKIKIGNVELNNNIFLAPMAGISDMPFRVLSKEQGAGLVYTEMVSSKGMFYNDKKTKKLTFIAQEERPVAVQMFGSDPQIVGQTVKTLSEDENIDIIDINMGCPAPKVVKNNEGSKLLENLPLIDEITKEAVKNSRVPITIKIRKGFKKEDNVAVEVAKIAEKNGVSAIAVHGRTREEYFSGDVDLDTIKAVKEAVSIPVIGNGNIIDGESAYHMFDYTGCDAIMIGRASNGNPWIFNKIIKYLENGEIIDNPTKAQIKEMILRHINMLADFKGEQTAVLEMRKQIAWYIKGFENASSIRNQVNQITDLDTLIATISNI